MKNLHKQLMGTVCERCGFVPEDMCQLDGHHKDGNHQNNAPDNIQTLCANCHRVITLLQRGGRLKTAKELMELLPHTFRFSTARKKWNLSSGSTGRFLERLKATKFLAGPFEGIFVNLRLGPVPQKLKDAVAWTQALALRQAPPGQNK